MRVLLPLVKVGSLAGSHSFFCCLSGQNCVTPFTLTWVRRRRRRARPVFKYPSTDRSRDLQQQHHLIEPQSTRVASFHTLAWPAVSRVPTLHLSPFTIKLSFSSLLNSGTAVARR